MTKAERQQLSDLSKSPGDLRDAIFRKYVEENYSHEYRKIHAALPYSLEEIYKVLGWAARENILWSRENWIKGNDIAAALGLDPGDFIAQAQQLHILVLSERRTLHFVHLLIRDHFACPALISALEDVDPVVRVRSAQRLGRLGVTRAVEPLSNHLLRDGDYLVRAYAALSLGAIGDSRAIDSLVVAIRQRDEYIRQNVVKALSQFDDVRVIPPLLIAVQDHDLIIRRDALRGLSKFDDPLVIERLLESLTDTPDMQYIARDALIKFGTRTIDPLINYVISGSQYLQALGTDIIIRMGHDAIPFLRRKLSDRSNAEMFVLRILGELGDTQAVEELMNILENKEEAISYREYSAIALGQIRDARAIKSLIVGLHSRHKRLKLCCVWALGEIGDPRVVPELIEELPDNPIWYGYSLCEQALDALSKIGTPEAITAIERWRQKL
jgi:HEAT repeat protein